SVAVSNYNTTSSTPSSHHDPYFTSHTLLIPVSFFFNDTATTEIYTLSLHDALPISRRALHRVPLAQALPAREPAGAEGARRSRRSEEHTSELQSRFDLVCRLLLEKKKNT